VQPDPAAQRDAVVPSPSPRASGRACSLIAAALLACSPALHGHELDLGLDSRYLYFSDLASPGEDAQPEHGLELEPRARLAHATRSGRYRIDYAGSYQRYYEQPELNALEHRVRARVRRKLNARTALEIDERYRDVSNLRFSLLDLDAGDTALGPTQQRFLANDLVLLLTHDLSARLFLRSEVHHQLVAFLETEDRNDSQAITASGELGYRLSPRSSVGVEMNGGRQFFDATASRTGSEADVIGLNLVFETRWNPRSVVSARWGPALVRSTDDVPAAVLAPARVGRRVEGRTFLSAFERCAVDRGSGLRLASGCDPATPAQGIEVQDGLGAAERYAVVEPVTGRGDDVLTHFGRLRYDGAHEDLTWSLFYERRLSTTAGNALASSLDRTGATLDYLPSGSAWRWYCAARLDRRRSITSGLVLDFALVSDADGAARRDRVLLRRINEADELDNVTLVAGLEHRLDRRTRASVEFRYLDAMQRNLGGRINPPDRYLFAVSLSHDFNPIRLHSPR
jgi:hypothetical protein